MSTQYPLSGDRIAFGDYIPTSICEHCRKETAEPLHTISITDDDGQPIPEIDEISLCDDCTPIFDSEEQKKANTWFEAKFGRNALHKTLRDEGKLTPRSNQPRRTSDIAKAARLELAKKSARMFAVMNLASVIIGLILGYIYAISEVAK